MFDEVSGEDGSGIVHEQELASFDEEIPTIVSPGDRVELQLDGSSLWVEVTTSNEDSLEGLSLETLEASNGIAIEIGDELQFTLTNIARCKHTA